MDATLVSGAAVMGIALHAQRYVPCYHNISALFTSFFDKLYVTLLKGVFFFFFFFEMSGLWQEATM